METVEVWQPLAVPRRYLHAEPVVRHREHHEAVGQDTAYPDFQGATRRTKLHRVGHQVLQDALQVASLDGDAAAGGEIGIGMAPGFTDVLTELALDFGVDLGKADRRCLGAYRPGGFQELIDRPRRGVDRTPHDPQSLL